MFLFLIQYCQMDYPKHINETTWRNCLQLIGFICRQVSSELFFRTCSGATRVPLVLIFGPTNARVPVPNGLNETCLLSLQEAGGLTHTCSIGSNRKKILLFKRDEKSLLWWIQPCRKQLPLTPPTAHEPSNTHSRTHSRGSSCTSNKWRSIIRSKHKPYYLRTKHTLYGLILYK